jgi:hypothetical protein
MAQHLARPRQVLDDVRGGHDVEAAIHLIRDALFENWP